VKENQRENNGLIEEDQNNLEEKNKQKL